VAGCADAAPASAFHEFPASSNSFASAAASTPPQANVAVATPVNRPLRSSFEKYSFEEAYFPTDGQTGGSPFASLSPDASRMPATIHLP
jgi:hypothetical protein